MPRAGQLDEIKRYPMRKEEDSPTENIPHYNLSITLKERFARQKTSYVRNGNQDHRQIMR